MRKILLASLLILASLIANAQSFMRYHMSDGSFNGFYTDIVDSVKFDLENGKQVQKVFTKTRTHTIPVDQIDSVTIERARLSDGDVGKYKICESNPEDSFFKKVYMDNRACAIASKTGEFGANDTIFFSSAYNDVKSLIITDSEGRLLKYFEEDLYLMFDYLADGTVDIIDLSDKDIIKVDNIILPFDAETKGWGAKAGKWWKEFINDYSVHEYLVGKYTSMNLDNVTYITDALTQIDENPELHNQRIIVDILSISGDLYGIVMTAIATGTSMGVTVPLLILQLADLSQDLISLMRHIYPDAEMLKKYKAFYSDKYKLYLSTFEATDITATAATMNGSIYAEDGLRGDLYFSLGEVLGTNYEMVPATKSYDKVNEWKLRSVKSDLKPDTWHSCRSVYTCKIDNLLFEFNSNNLVDFTTLKPSAYTGEAHDVTSYSAIVDCEFKNSEACWCGVRYASTENEDGASVTGVATANSSGKQSITLSDLLPNATYTYYAVATYEGKEFKGDTRSFTTEEKKLPDLSGHWTFDQNIFGDPSLSIYLELVNSSSTSATYSARSGFYGSNSLSVTLYKDLSARINTISIYDIGSMCEGTFNEDCTSMSGDGYLFFTTSTDSWQDKPWCFHR